MKIYTVNATCELAELTAKLAGGDPFVNRIIFCEDKFTLELEIALAKAYGGTFGTRVFTFNRFMHKYLPESAEVLSPESAVLIIKRLLLENKGSLTCFKNVYDPNLSGVVYELIAQLKSAKITPNDIFRASEGCSGILKRKLDDIYLLFSEYERFITANNLTDGNNRLSRLPEFFAQCEFIKQSEVIIAGFPSLNRTLCEIFKSLNKNAKSLTFALVAGDNTGVYTNETYNFAMGEFKGERIAQTISEERAALLANLYSPKGNAKKITEPKAHIYRAQSINEEVEHVARLIADGIRNGNRKIAKGDEGCNSFANDNNANNSFANDNNASNSFANDNNASNSFASGMCYKDFAVCAEDISSYALTIRRVFADYGIPCFIDTSSNLGKHPLTTAVTAYIDAIRRGFSLPDYLRFVKNPIVTPDRGLSDGFENYVLKHAIDKRGIFKPFVCEDEHLEEYEQLRQSTIGLFEKNLFGECERGGLYSFSTVADGIRELLEAINAETKTEELGRLLADFGGDELVAYNEQSFQRFIDSLNAAEGILGDKNLPLNEIKNVIVSGMTACKISVIQQYTDCVFVGDFRAVKYKKHPVLFVLGLNDGVPSAKFDSALLCDRDIVGMEQFDVSVEPKIKEVNRRNRENACMAIASFVDNLFLSWSARGGDGEEHKASDMIDYVISAFSVDGGIPIFDRYKATKSAELIGGIDCKRFKALPYMTERSSAFGFAREISAYKEGESNQFDGAGCFYAVMKDKDMRALPDGLLGAVNNEIGYYTNGVNYAPEIISATAIEGFFLCPYKNFLSQGLKLKQREEGTIRANVIGNLVHETAQLFTERADFDGTSANAKTLAESIFEEVSAKEEYSRYGNTGAGKTVLGFLKKETVRFCLNMFEGCNHSKFRPKYLEVSFGYSGGRPPIKLKTQTGEYKIVGKADRVDVYGDKTCIIDYKTGAVTDSVDQDLYCGKKLQLYLYAKAFSDEYKPVGAYYYPIADNFGESEEDVMAMRGKTLADLDTACEIDDSIADERRKGRFISANLTQSKEGSFRYDSALLTEEEFQAYLDYAVGIAAEGVTEINSGVIIPSPTDGACEYCEYHGICGYDEAIDGRLRKFNEKIKKESVLAAVAHERDSECMNKTDCSGSSSSDGSGSSSSDGSGSSSSSDLNIECVDGKIATDTEKRGG